MTVEMLAKKLGYKVITGDSKNLDKKVEGVYACDLLSHAMAKINSHDLWVTVHTNLNVVAVASLTEASCVVIPESIEIEQQSIIRAEEKGVVFLSAPVSSAQVCFEVLKLLSEEL